MRVALAALTLIVCFSLSAFSDILDSESSPELYQRIKGLVEESTTPYPLYDILVTDVDGPTYFNACAMVAGPSENFEVKKIEDAIAWENKIVVKPDNGPLDPGVTNRFVRFKTRAWLEYYLEAGYQMADGVLDIDSHGVSTDEIEYCTDGTSVEDAIKSTQFGLNSDQTAYVSREFCNNGDLIAEFIYKASGDFLVASLTRFLGPEEDRGTQYMYCW